MKVKAEVILFGKKVSIEIDVPENPISLYLGIDDLEEIIIDDETITIVTEMVNDAIRDTDFEWLVTIINENNNEDYSPDNTRDVVDDEKYIWRTKKDKVVKPNLKRI